MYPDTKPTDKRFNLLLRMPNWLGDCVMAMPAVRHLVETLPEARIYLGGREGFRNFFLAQPGVSGFVPAPDSGVGNLVKGMTATRRFLRDGGVPGGIDVGLLLTNSVSTAAWLWRLGANIRIGYNRDCRRLFLTYPVPCGGVESSWHFVRYYLWLAKFAEAVVFENEAATERHTEPLTDYMTPTIRVGDEARREAESLLVQLGVSERYAVFAPASAYGPVKDWPVRHYRDLASALVKQGMAVVVTGSAKQADVCAAVTEGIRGAVNLAGQTSLDAFAGLLAGASLFVGGDSGGAHVAGALGVPTVVIFGITNPTRTRAGGRRVVCVGDGEAVDVKLSTPAARKAAQAALEAIEPARVLAEIQRVTGEA
ncbi:MAG: glycosyltransferase family 9 protein [Planctomycetaceae bacterium]|nr:glycosyltransferase family 9 protein [Planctomycetaceae bacterium]